MDPQLRLLLEVSYEAIVDSGGSLGVLLPFREHEG